MLVLGTITDEQQHATAREAVYQGVEHRLRPGIDPVKIFKHKEDRTAAALLKEQQLHCFQCPLPLLLRIERLPLRIINGKV